MTQPVLVADFDAASAVPPRGRALIDAARGAGCGWAALRVGEDVSALGPALAAAAAAGAGVLVRLDDTRGIAGLEEACAALGEKSVPLLRDRLLVVVPGERHGKRLRAEARWAPSALELVGREGLRRVSARLRPNFLRAQADCDDLVVPGDLFDEPALGRLAAKLRLRGARLYVTGFARDDASRLGGLGVHGLVLSL